VLLVPAIYHSTHPSILVLVSKVSYSLRRIDDDDDDDDVDISF